MYLTIDVGGTKTLLTVFTKEGEQKEAIKFETPAVYESFLSELADTVAKLSTSEFSATAIALPGKINREQGVGVAFGNLAWQHIPIRDNVSRITGTKVYVENDANLAGLSEARLLPEYRRVLYITVSTGIGGVIIQDGKIDPGTQDAEIGHILLEHGGRLTRWEDFASGRAIVAKFGKRASDIAPDDNQTWYVVARNIAIGLIDVIAMLTPEAIVFGGGVGSHFPKYKDRLLEELKIYENPLLTVPPLLQAQRAEEAVVYGCYELLKDNDGSATDQTKE